MSAAGGSDTAGDAVSLNRVPQLVQNTASSLTLLPQ